jgi:tetratricopeptide (TPR) repeat protein
MPTLEKLQEDLKNQKEKISQLRKKGFNTKIPEMKIMNIPHKIAMAKVTQKQRDVQIVLNLLENLKREIEEVENLSAQGPDIGKEAEETYRKEIEALRAEESGQLLKSLAHDEIIIKTNKLINDAYAYLNNQNYDKCLHAYVEIKNIYRYLPKNLKGKYYKDAINIHKGLLESGLFDKIMVKKQNFFQRLKSIFLGKRN